MLPRQMRCELSAKALPDRYASRLLDFHLRPGQGATLPPDKGSVTFEQEVRTIFERIRHSLSKLGAGMNHVVSIKTYLTDLGPYAVFSRIRGEFFPKDPPTSTAVQVAGLLLNAKIEIDAIAFLPAGPAA